MRQTLLKNCTVDSETHSIFFGAFFPQTRKTYKLKPALSFIYQSTEKFSRKSNFTKK